MNELLYGRKILAELDELPPDVRRETVETLAAVRDRPDEVLEESGRSGYFEVEIGEHTLIVDWIRDEDRIDVLSIDGPRRPT